MVRHWRIWLIGAAAAAAAAMGWWMPPPVDSGLHDSGAARPFAAAASAAIVAISSLPVLLLPATRRRTAWALLAGAALAAALAAAAVATRVRHTCTVAYFDTTIVAGTEYTPLALDDLRVHPHQSREEMVRDAAGNAEWIWTRASVERCRTRLAATYVLPVPIFVLCLLAAAQAAPAASWAPAAGRRPRVPLTQAPGEPAPRYDVFLSYRHEEPDRTLARDLLVMLEADGCRVAIDERDFRAHEHVLQEMERCVRESRFTVAIVSSRYLQSGHCEEEAVICRTLDVGERRRRLIPVFVERVNTPAWLHGLVGIDATQEDPLVHPFERLRRAVREHGAV